MLSQVGYAKAFALRKALDRGVAAWRAAPLHAPRYLSRPLLQAALRYLEAGYRLDEAHLEVILRSALVHGVGVLTALTYQRTLETVVHSCADALTAASSPLSLTILWRMQLSDLGPSQWDKALGDELRARLDEVSLRSRTHVAAAIYQLDTGLPVLEEFSAVQLGETASMVEKRAWSLDFRLIVATLITVGLLLAGLRFLPGSADGAADLITFQSGDYRLAQANPVSATQSPSGHPVYVAEFGIMPNEVTVAAYRRCVEARACRTPILPSSALRPDYFLDSAYDDFPVVHVSWEDAVAFCDWRDMRLLTATEWEVAASYSPLTGQFYTYPWGNRFDPLFANHAGFGVGDTLPVGFYHPYGNSAAGARDMAGNVAEWTSTAGGTGEQGMLVKGGSFLDRADQLAVFVERIVDPKLGYAWLGFRCAR